MEATKLLLSRAMIAVIAFGAISCDGSDSTPTPTSPEVSADFEHKIPNDASMLVAGHQVAFTDKSTGNPTSWEWTFAGGQPATSTAQNPTVTYNAPGVYGVSLKASNATKNNTMVKESLVFVFPSGATIYLPFSSNLNDYFGVYAASKVEVPSLSSDKNGKASAAFNLSQGASYTGFDPKVSTEMTMAMWLKPNVDMNGGTSQRQVFTVQGNGLFQCYYVSGRWTFEIYTKTAGGARGVSTFTSTQNITANIWYHIAITVKKGAPTKIYINGNEAASSPSINENLQSDKLTLELGSSFYADFNGVMDEYMLFNRQLSASEISFLHTKFPR